MNDFWDERYAGETYKFGKTPADFLVREAHRLPTRSRVLCVADGEGRNSAWLAGEGHEVTAFDASPRGVEKAKALATGRGVSVTHQVVGVEDWDWSQTFDVVAAIFIQFAAPDLRSRIFEGLRRAVAPGGLLLLHGYAPRQIGYGTGGPPVAQNMYTLDLLEARFGDWEMLVARDYDAVIEEGTGHSGRSALIDYVARRPL